MTKKTILITGAAGFIGFHAALALKKRGDVVLGIDNFNDYYSLSLKQKRAALLKEQGIDVVSCDVCDKEGLNAIFKNLSFTHVLHLAAQAGVRYAEKNPDSYLKSNLEGFLVLLEQLKLNPEIKLIYASSSSVYGTTEKIPFSEEDETDKPANLYAATKKANELMAYSYHHLYGIHATALRFFTVYGPWGRPDMAYYSFAQEILQNKPIHLFNEGKMQRDFTYIDDVVDAICASIDLGAAWEVFNIGNNKSVGLLTFVEFLEKHLNKKAQKIFGPPSLGEVKTTFACIEHAKNKLNFFPKTSLFEGLGHFTHWFQQYHKAF